jgi:hypothetical protein
MSTNKRAILSISMPISIFIIYLYIYMPFKYGQNKLKLNAKTNMSLGSSFGRAMDEIGRRQSYGQKMSQRFGIDCLPTCVCFHIFYSGDIMTLNGRYTVTFIKNAT